MKADHERVKALLAESITVLCKNGLQYRTKFTIQGLLGITLDDEDVFLVDIHEKVGETTLPGLGDKRPGSPGEKSPRREHGSRRKKRRRKSSSQSDVSPSRSASPAPDDFEETIRKEPTVSNENPTQTTVVGDCGNKQTNNPTIVSIEDHSSVEQILELAKDIPPWAGNGNEDDMISTDAGAGTCSSGFNSASENPDGATSSNIIVKTEEDDEIVFVKQEQSDSFPSHTRTRSDEMFPGGSFQGPANNPQTDFLAQGPFQHPQPFPPLPDQSFTQGPGTSQSDSFQRPEDSAGSDIPSGSQAVRQTYVSNLEAQVSGLVAAKRILELDKQSLEASYRSAVEKLSRLSHQNMTNDKTRGDHYVPKRGMQIANSNYVELCDNKVMPDGYRLLVAGANIAVPVTWYDTTLRACNNKGASFTLKMVTNGFVQPWECKLGGTSAYVGTRLEGVLQALKLFGTVTLKMSLADATAALNQKIASGRRTWKKFFTEEAVE